MPKRPAAPADLPGAVPVFPLSGALLLPFSHRPLNVFEQRYIDMVDDALRADRLIGLIQPEDPSEESPKGQAPLQRVGCLGRITHFEENGDGRYFIILEGVCRFRALREVTTERPYRMFEISGDGFAADFERSHGEDQVDRVRFVRMMRDYAEFANVDLNWEEIERTGTADLVNFCCMVSPYGAAEKQVLLEAQTLNERAETLIAMTEYEMAKGGGTAAPLN
ncbi:LON peptidase substrate-binding domain-containing protein [Devosia sp. 63-57]|uniref:LON peptidase substrate-binding domain-containing protein n=1 Tax=Devosia sp. 63-57 TaxID=1895751 RepID=UPI0008692AED|nr:LON peptidase substrate-binding domain-containing protein [Devosia sp. 63-57]ODT47940.1 MAG: peptidase S16 [Pelagibacterium sp. SCN 63-126]ODU87909.1 MAG: peptidase S16 [Pelagibacterium sp. SCN 63-17]OJX42350.1 MAG: peptidase S16 [Devosia sp. 63-57]